MYNGVIFPLVYNQVEYVFDASAFLHGQYRHLCETRQIRCRRCAFGSAWNNYPTAEHLPECV